MSTGPGTSTEPTAPAQTGRPVVLTPVAPGLWLVIGGGIIAALGPLFGLLVGSMIGTTEQSDLSPLFLWLMGGIVVGAVGVGMVLLGARRLLRDRRAARQP